MHNEVETGSQDLRCFQWKKESNFNCQKVDGNGGVESYWKMFIGSLECDYVHNDGVKVAITVTRRIHTRICTHFGSQVEFLLNHQGMNFHLWVETGFLEGTWGIFMRILKIVNWEFSRKRGNLSTKVWRLSGRLVWSSRWSRSRNLFRPGGYLNHGCPCLLSYGVSSSSVAFVSSLGVSDATVFESLLLL